MRDEASRWGIDRCARLIEMVRCGQRAIEWRIRDCPNSDGFVAVGLCGHCCYWWDKGPDDGWRPATREEAVVCLIQNE